jgi:hypothetical protein
MAARAMPLRSATAPSAQDQSGYSSETWTQMNDWISIKSRVARFDAHGAGDDRGEFFFRMERFEPLPIEHFVPLVVSALLITAFSGDVGAVVETGFEVTQKLPARANGSPAWLRAACFMSKKILTRASIGRPEQRPLALHLFVFSRKYRATTPRGLDEPVRRSSGNHRAAD